MNPSTLPPEGNGPLPYAGLRVLDLASGSFPLCAQLLGELGAEVVMVETGDAATRRSEVGWIACNAGKKSVHVADASSAQALTTLETLAAAADVLIDAPGPLARIADARSINPSIVHATISPFGRSGPRAHWKADELAGQAAGGILSLSGSADFPPARLGFPLATGVAATQALVGVLVALARRARTGEGARIDASMQEAVANLLFTAQSSAHVENHAQRRGASALGAGLAERKGMWACRDGVVIWVIWAGRGQGRKNESTFQWMEDKGWPEVKDLRAIDWEALSISDVSQAQMNTWNRVFERFFLAHTKDEVKAAAVKYRILAYTVNDMADVAKDPVLAERAAWVRVELPDGRTAEVVGTPFRSTAHAVRHRGRVSRPGEHAGEVLRTWTAKPAVPIRPSRELPFAGLKVLDFSWAVISPVTSKFLAMFGADVAKLEWRRRPDGSRMGGPFPLGRPGIDMSAMFANINAGKLSVGFNIGDPALRPFILKMAADADIVLENFSVGTIGKCGYSYDDLKAVNPDLIMMSASLTGQTGSRAKLPGLGSHLQAMAGIDHVTGYPEGPAGGPNQVMPDLIGPAMAIVSVLAALEHRRKTGEGQYIDLSQYEAIATYLRPLMLRYRLEGVAPSRQGGFSGEFCPEGVYPAAGEDRWIAITVSEDEEWRRLQALLPGPTQARFPASMPFAERLARRVELDAAIGAWTRGEDRYALTGRLQALGIAVMPVQDAVDVRDDPQLKHRGHYHFPAHPKIGRVPVDGPAFRIEGLDPAIRHGPMYASSTRDVMTRWLGMPAEEIESLVEKGTIEAR